MAWLHFAEKSVRQVLMSDSTGACGNVSDMDIVANGSFVVVGMEEALLINQD